MKSLDDERRKIELWKQTNGIKHLYNIVYTKPKYLYNIVDTRPKPKPHEKGKSYCVGCDIELYDTNRYYLLGEDKGICKRCMYRGVNF